MTLHIAPFSWEYLKCVRALLTVANRMGESYPLGRLRPSLLMIGADRIGERASCILMIFDNRMG